MYKKGDHVRIKEADWDRDKDPYIGENRISPALERILQETNRMLTIVKRFDDWSMGLYWVEEYSGAIHKNIIEGMAEETSPSTKSELSTIAERAFIVGYFNRPDPPASYIDDIADGHLKEAWERCKPFIFQQQNQ